MDAICTFAYFAIMMLCYGLAVHLKYGWRSDDSAIIYSVLILIIASLSASVFYIALVGTLCQIYIVYRYPLHSLSASAEPWTLDIGAVLAVLQPMSRLDAEVINIRLIPAEIDVPKIEFHDLLISARPQGRMSYTRNGLYKYARLHGGGYVIFRLDSVEAVGILRSLPFIDSDIYRTQIESYAQRLLMTSDQMTLPILYHNVDDVMSALNRLSGGDDVVAD